MRCPELAQSAARHRTAERRRRSAALLHVPYKGAANALLDLVAGQVGLMLSNYVSLAPQIKAGKVRPLAVTSGETSPVFPDLAPLAASAPGFAM